MLFGDRLKILREDKDVTQKELGAAVGVSDRVIGYYESNDRFPKDENTLKALADYFNVSVDYLLGRADTKSLGTKRLSQKVETIAAHLDDKDITPKKMRMIQDYIDLLFDDEE
ncbi:helix-turn-helix transcriptional regulator [Clostridium sp.]|uniref:helix-turn-helix domain-containing protein n=1 Tax=Clostridium sp. TaxID=1506 RepID=UPI0026019A49|nr:helix-turn-helix transcriptional regulator [Clostridium sp.]